MKAARANSAFNEWYGALPPAQAAEFHYGAMQTPNTLSINGVSGATERSGDELSALARQKAREHFTANVLPTDQEYNQLGVQHAIERHGGTVGGAVAPLGPSYYANKNTRTSATKTDPVTGDRVTTTELPEKPEKPDKPKHDLYDYAQLFGKGIYGAAELGLKRNQQLNEAGKAAGTLAETKRHNEEMEAKAKTDAETAKGKAGLDAEKTRINALMKAYGEENKSIFQRISQGASKDSTVTMKPEELQGLYQRLNENVKKMMELGNPTPPTTQPNHSGGVGSGGGEIKGAPATGTTPFQPAKIPEGHVPYDPSQPAHDGQEGVNGKGEPIFYDEKRKGWFKRPAPPAQLPIHEFDYEDTPTA